MERENHKPQTNCTQAELLSLHGNLFLKPGPVLRKMATITPWLPHQVFSPFSLLSTGEYDPQHWQLLQATLPYANEPKPSVDAAGCVSKHLTLQGKTAQSIKKPISNVNWETQARERNKVLSISSHGILDVQTRLLTRLLLSTLL